MGDKISPVEIAKEGIKYARENSLNVVIIDTVESSYWWRINDWA